MAVLGAAPITFISESTSTPGKQYQIPLSLLTIGTNGVIDPSSWPGFTSADKPLVTALLASMVSQGLLTKPPSS